MSATERELADPDGRDHVDATPSPDPRSALSSPIGDGSAEHPAAGGDKPSSASSLASAARPLLALLANVTVVTALLVYFGWRRSETQASLIGIDGSVLGMTTQEYVLRSVRPIISLLIGIGIVGLVAVVLDRTAGPWLERDPRIRVRKIHVPVTVLVVLGTWVLVAVVIFGLDRWWPATRFVLFPILCGAGVIVLIYVAARARSTDGTLWLNHQQRFAFGLSGVLLVLVTLFWTTSNYAELRGRALADALDCSVHLLPSVVVTSRDPLELRGVESSTIGNQPGTYRYEKLRFLENTGGNFFLIPDSWRISNGTVFILPDDESDLRIDFVTDQERDRAVYEQASTDGCIRPSPD